MARLFARQAKGEVMSIQGSREDIREYNKQLVDAYYDGESVDAIATRSGRSTSTIHKLISADKAANGPRDRKCKPVDPRSMIDKRVISPRHGWIGIQMSRYRAELGLTPSAFGMLINATRTRVRYMEIGSHDFTLTEIVKLVEVLNIPFEQLITPKAMGH